MIIKNGYSKSIPTPNTSNPNPDVSSQISSLKNQSVVARVKDIVLDENHPKFREVGEWNGIGTIYYELNNSIGSNTGTLTAKPVDPHSKTYPLINELVLLFNLPNQNIGQNTSATSYFYMNPISIWNHPHHDAYPNQLTSNILPPSQQQDYQQTEGGSVRRVSDSSTEIQLNSPVNPSQNTFVEKTNIHPIMPFMGDVIFEGRHGQSLRFGSTAKSNSIYANNWSSVGSNGDPIVIIRNGQSPRASSEGWLPITEDIRNDLSSIYLTSFQRLQDFKVASELYSSYTTPPIAPSLFTQPQIALNSNRIVINAKTDSVLLSAQKSVGISTKGSANIDANSFYISSNDVRLGSKNATEPVLKGDTTIEVLKQLTKAIKDLATILEVEKNWPGGNLQTGYNAVAGNVLIVLEDIVTQLNGNNLKSLTTKVQ
jgi:hypothetical protein